MSSTADKGQELAMRIGRVLLENGAEIARVQDTMQRVATAYGVEDFNAFVLTNAIFISGKGEGITDGNKIKFVPNFSIHFTKISELNQLSREIAGGALTVEEANKRMDYIENIPFYTLWKRAVACGAGCACFCFLLTGLWNDCIVAFLGGVSIELFLDYATKKNISKFITYILASAIAAFVAVVMFSLGIGAQLAIIIIGSILRLVPGMSMTVSIRDFFNGDYLSGMIRMVDALSVGGCIAIGVGIVISIAENFVKGISI